MSGPSEYHQALDQASPHAGSTCRPSPGPALGRCPGDGAGLVGQALVARPCPDPPREALASGSWCPDSEPCVALFFSFIFKSYLVISIMLTV